AGTRDAAMAGDIGIVESIIASPGAAPAGASLEGAAPVLHEYGPAVRIRIGGPPAPGPAPAALKEDALSPNERLGLLGLRLRGSSGSIIGKNRRPYQALAWAQGPARLHAQEQPVVGLNAATGISGAAIAAAPLAKRLAGRVAVGVIMVSGPGSLALTNAQQIKIAAEVQNGL